MRDHVALPVLTALLALTLQGCLLDRSGLAPLDAAGLDSALADSGRRDASALDADPMLDAGRIDGGPSDAGRDASRPDAGPVCVGPPTCDGERVRRCAGGGVAFDNCADDNAYCDSGACVDRVCEPSEVTCSAVAEESRCDLRGSALEVQPCPRGCVEGSGCTPPTACALGVFGTIQTSGSATFNTCGQGNDATFLSGCTRVDISGSDLIVRLEVPERADYRIELDGDDPLLYLRTACDVAASEIACDDDGGPSRASEIDITLDPGDYFIVADSFRDTDEGPEGRCGPFDLTVSIR